MGCETFSVRSIRQHRDGVHMPRVTFEQAKKPGELPVLTMMGRTIPVISAEQLTRKLTEIGCQEELTEEIVVSLFGYAVSTEAAVACAEVSESLV